MALHKVDTTSFEIDDLAAFGIDTPEENLHQIISQFAQKIRDAGHQEPAHFIEVAALILRDQQPR